MAQDDVEHVQICLSLACTDSKTAEGEWDIISNSNPMQRHCCDVLKTLCTDMLHCVSFLWPPTELLNLLSVPMSLRFKVQHVVQRKVLHVAGKCS